MQVKFEVEGLDRIHKATQAVRDSVAKELQKALYVSGKRVEAEAKKSILDGQKTGVTYTRGTVEHRASAPGEAPASDTGRLVNSINTEMGPGTATVKAGGGIVKYARMLEFGTVKMAARPFLFPALNRSKGYIQERLNKAVRDGALKVVRKK